MLALNLLLVSIFLVAAPSFSSQSRHFVHPPQATEIKIALIGDTGAGVEFGDVLKLISSEMANLVMINGDLGYASSPEEWKQRILSSIDINKTPVIGTLGNHDLGKNTERYIQIFRELRTPKNALTTICTGQSQLIKNRDTIAVDELCTIGNVTIVGNAIGQVYANEYLESRLESKLRITPKENWKLVGYHFTPESMNPGIKGDEASFKFFNIIRQFGAIGAQAHTHSVMASCPIVSEFNKDSPIQCHRDFSDPDNRFIMPGTGIFVDSSIGGKNPRGRSRCEIPTERGCEHMVDLISKEGYTRTDGSKRTDFIRQGALFFIFNLGGDPTRARAYYKSIDGQEIFSFMLSRRKLPQS